MLRYLPPILLTALCFAQPGFCFTDPALVVEQEGSPPAPATTADESFAVPDSVDRAVGIDKATLAEALEPLDIPGTERALQGWVALLEPQHEAYLEALAEAQQTGQSDAVNKLGSDRDLLLARAEQTLAALVAKGGRAAAVRERLAAIRAASAADAVATVPVNQTTAQDIPIEVLRAKLRPMTLDQAQAELEHWLELLRGKCLEVSNAEIPALRSQDPAEVEQLNARAVALRAERGRLIERTDAVIDAVDTKGGDADLARAYVTSVAPAPPITGLRAALSTTQAWLTNPDGGLALGLRLVRSLAVFLAAWVLALFVGSLAGRAMSRLPRASQLLKRFVAVGARRAVLFLGFLAALSQLGLNMGPMLAAIGAAGLVVGLALQGTLSNFASGILIMIYRPFDVGDVIATSGPTGKVEGMTLVTTTIKTFDNQTVHMPNNTIWGGVITNITANATRRVDMAFGIGYSDDTQRAEQVLLEVLERHPKVLEDPQPLVRLHELGESSVNFIVRPWALTEDYWDVYWDVTRTVKQRFDAEGISIPFPQRDVHLIADRADADDKPRREPPHATVAPAAGKDPAPVDEEAQTSA